MFTFALLTDFLKLNMKKSVFFIVILTFFMNSCYVYHPIEAKNNEKIPPIQEQLKPNQIYKIDVDNKTYKIKVVKWEKDSLVADVKIGKDIKKSFSAKQITNVKEYKFSDTRSNILTVLSYIALGVGIAVLVR